MNARKRFSYGRRNICGGRDYGARAPLCAGCVKKSAVNVDNRVPPPPHHKARLPRYAGDHARRKVFPLARGADKIHVLALHHKRHAFLRFRNGELRAVQPRVFFWHRVKINVQARGELPHGDCNAARAKVITADNFSAHIGISKKPLNFALFNGVAFLYFGGGGFNGTRVVLF